MYKIIIVMTMLLTGIGNAYSQNNEVLDTLWEKPDRYFANYYPPTDWMENPSVGYSRSLRFDYGELHVRRADSSFTSTHRLLHQLHTDHPLKIVGIAYYARKDIPYYKDSVILYDMDSMGNMVQLWARGCDAKEEDNQLLLDIPYESDEEDQCGHSPRLPHRLILISESYLDEPIIVEDSFYVGFTDWYHDGGWGNYSCLIVQWWRPLMDVPWNRCGYPVIPKMYWESSTDTWHRTDVDNFSYMIWPIIDVEYGQDTIDSVSVGRVETVEEIKVSPNPARERVSVEASRMIDHLWVKNTQGVEIYNNTHCTNRVELNVNWWSKGVYILYMQLDGDPVLHARKLVVE